MLINAFVATGSGSCKKGGGMKLHVVIEKDEAGYFVAEAPALPGCLSQGKTHEEAITNIIEAVKGWLEVMESKYTNDPSKFIEVAV